MIEVIVGAILPPIIDIVNSHIEKSQHRFYVSIAICVIIGVAMSLTELTPSDPIKSALVVLMTAQAIYKKYWEESEVRQELLDN